MQGVGRVDFASSVCLRPRLFSGPFLPPPRNSLLQWGQGCLGAQAAEGLAGWPLVNYAGTSSHLSSLLPPHMGGAAGHCVEEPNTRS